MLPANNEEIIDEHEKHSNKVRDTLICTDEDEGFYLFYY